MNDELKESLNNLGVDIVSSTTNTDIIKFTICTLIGMAAGLVWIVSGKEEK